MGTRVCPEANTLLLPGQGYEKEVEGKRGRVREHEYDESKPRTFYKLTLGGIFPKTAANLVQTKGGEIT